MKRQIPRGDDGFDCPLHQKPMNQVCHTCPWWTQVRGTNPQTGQEIDNWQCAIAWLPTLLIENSQQQRQTGAAIESFRNETAKQNMAAINVVESIARHSQQSSAQHMHLLQGLASLANGRVRQQNVQVLDHEDIA